MATTSDLFQGGPTMVTARFGWSPVARRALAVALGLLLLAASLLRLWSDIRYPQPPHPSGIENSSVSDAAAISEPILGCVLLAGLWPRHAWIAAVSAFSLFAIITVAETIQGRDSCGCFGVVHIRPAYTMCLDIAALTLLFIIGRPGPGSEVVGRGSAKRRWITAGAIGVAWVGIVLGMWLTRPVIAATMTTTPSQISREPGQTFGNPGDPVVLEPEKWIGQHFSLADHFDVGAQVSTGQWVILLVHHDCDHCAAAVPRYVAEYAGPHSSFIVPPSTFPSPVRV